MSLTILLEHLKNRHKTIINHHLIIIYLSLNHHIITLYHQPIYYHYFASLLTIMSQHNQACSPVPRRLLGSTRRQLQKWPPTSLCRAWTCGRSCRFGSNSTSCGWPIYAALFQSTNWVSSWTMLDLGWTNVSSRKTHETETWLNRNGWNKMLAGPCWTEIVLQPVLQMVNPDAPGGE